MANSDTYAPSYASIAVAVANQPERKKQQKYAYLGPGHIFTLIAIESSGTETLKFVKDLGHHFKLASGENSAHPFLLQRLLVAVQQHGNAASSAAICYGFFGLIACRWRTFLCVIQPMQCPKSHRSFGFSV